MNQPLSFVDNRTLVKNAARNLLGQGVPLLVALYCIPQLISVLGTDRFGFLTLIWVIIGYLSIFDLGLGRALTKLVGEKIGRAETDEIPQLVWTVIWLLCAWGIVAMLLAQLALPYLVDMFNLPAGLQDEARAALAVAALALPCVILAGGASGLLEAYQRFDLINRVRIPLGIFTFAAPLAIASSGSSGLVAITFALGLGRLAFLGATAWLCLKVNPALRRPHRLQRESLGSLLRFGGWMTATNLFGPLMVHLDRFVIGALLSMTAVAYYVTPYEVVTRLWILPGALVGVLFPAFATNLTRQPARTARLFGQAMDAIFALMLPLTLLVMAFAQEGLSLWLEPDFAVHSVRVLQILAVGVLINSFGRVPSVFLQAAGRPDLPARLFVVELPLYLVALWYLLGNWGVEGAAFAWTGRIVLDNVMLLGACARVVPSLKATIWRGIAMSILPVVLLAGTELVVQPGVKTMLLIAAIALFTVVAYRSRSVWRPQAPATGAAAK